jgi:hypothetical protein
MGRRRGPMADKLNIPDEICPGNPQYSPWTDLRVNGWLLVAALISGAADILFPGVVAQWHVAVRVGIVLAQFLAIALWIRSLLRWIAGMDELHRQVTLKPVLFATCATLFAVMLWHRLAAAGIFSGPATVGNGPGASGEILTVAHVFLLLTVTYFASYFAVRRRYE